MCVSALVWCMPRCVLASNPHNIFLKPLMQAILDMCLRTLHVMCNTGNLLFAQRNIMRCVTQQTMQGMLARSHRHSFGMLTQQANLQLCCSK